MQKKLKFIASLLFITAQFFVVHAKEKVSLPNIVYILADDMGFGDVQAMNPDGKIPTPNMNQLAAEGMKFTDAHSNSSVCTPTRYGILTGRYCWRSKLKSGVTWGASPPLIEDDRMTVASMLKKANYNTACIGKWHLGLGWQFKEDSKNKRRSSKDIDYSKPITSGPNELGFDYFFGISASLDMDPYVYIENNKATMVPNRNIPKNGGMAYWRPGPIAENFKHIEVLDKLTEKAVDYIKKQKKEKPFFLYFPLPSPHKPIIPENRFQNKSGLNPWGDFVMQTDWTVGQIMKTLKEKGLNENTIFIVTSDNGTTPGADFKFLEGKGHFPSAKLRGHKADIFEGGHRVAFITSWPAVIKAGSTSKQTICHTDLMATAADIIDYKLPDNAAEDSYSLLPLFKGNAKNTIREATVHHSINGTFAIRKGKWKLSLCKGSGGWSFPRPRDTKNTKDLPGVQLYDLSSDIGERKNLQDKYPEVVKEMTALLQKYVDQGRSTPGAAQQNNGKVSIIR